MICTDALARLLEADLPVLRGEGDDPLALHIRSCSRCQETAAVILDGEAGLAQSLAAVLPPLELEEILERADALEGEEVVPIARRRPRWTRSGAGFTLIPLAAAAALTAIFFGRTPNLPGPEYTPETGGLGLNVEVPQGQSVAVLETSNPEITVLWLF